MKKTKEKSVRIRVKLPKSMHRAGEKIADEKGFKNVGKWVTDLVITDLTRRRRRKKPALVATVQPGQPA